MATKRRQYKKSNDRKPFWERVLEWVLGSVKKMILPALVIWLVAWLWIGGIFAKTGDVMWRGFVDWTAQQGLVVQDVVIEGRNRVDINDLQQAIKVKPNDPLLDVDVNAIHDAIEDLNWVGSVVVRRSYNGVVTIDLIERIPFVIWDRPGRGLVVVDMMGKVIPSVSPTDFESLLVVRGVDAPQYASNLMRMVVAEPEVAKHVRGAEWIGGRRWDLLTAQSVRIHLPADDMGYALSRLAKAIREKNILDQSLKSLDLRASDRIIIESQKGMARNF